jgi:integrase
LFPLGPPAGRAPSWGAPQLERVFADALLPTSCAMHAVEMAREGVPLVVIQRQLGHSNLGITSVYLQGIDNAEICMLVGRR